jgi:Sugar transferases involved in lipopolysaccharide synthesis
MKSIFKIMAEVACLCLGAGFIVSRAEKKKGWTEGHKPGWYERNVKRLFDFSLSMMTVIFLWPVMMIILLLVRVKLGSPVLFRQQRPGLGGKVFEIRKFRTMSDQRGDDGELLPDAERLTSFGKMLRSTSLDELPELFNIIKGDMSIIGPRPLLTEYLPKYSAEQRHRHDVRPGLTGLAQVSGRNGLSWDKKLEDDVKYVGNITFLGDLKILADTVAIVFRREGITSSTSATMESFMGNEE